MCEERAGRDQHGTRASGEALCDSEGGIVGGYGTVMCEWLVQGDEEIVVYEYICCWWCRHNVKQIVEKGL